MTTKLQDLHLRHVDPSKLLFQHRHPAFPDAVPAPEWFEAAGVGTLRFSPWWRGTVIARLETKAKKDAYFVVVEVFGLYMTDEQAAEQSKAPSGEIDPSTLNDASPEETEEFALRALDDLYPFVRSELYSLSGRMQGVLGVMLQPYPQIRRSSSDDGDESEE